MLVIAVLCFLLEKSAVSNAKCGGINDNDGSRIVGGEEVGYQKYPWFVNIRKIAKGHGPVCGGVLITQTHVLTAAHCWPKKHPERPYQVAMNTYDRCKDPEEGREVHKINKVIIHEKYAKNPDFYDIAIVEMATKSRLEPACMPSPKTLNRSEPGLIMGFGDTEEGGASGLPCKLMQAAVQKYSPKECEKTSIPQLYQNTGTTFCGGADGKDTCQGDSGGPFMTYGSDGSYVVSGIVSTGYGCAEKGYPGIYTNVAAYLDWIDSKLDGETTETAPVDDDEDENDNNEDGDDNNEEDSRSPAHEQPMDLDSSAGGSQRVFFPGQRSSGQLSAGSYSGQGMESPEIGTTSGSKVFFPAAAGRRLDHSVDEHNSGLLGLVEDAENGGDGGNGGGTDATDNNESRVFFPSNRK